MKKSEKPKKIEKHDGVSPIIIPAVKSKKQYKNQFQELWDYLVPESGKAQTAQGEVIRIAGKIRHEMMDNGCMNWDDDFRKMLKAFLEYVQLGNLLPKNVRDAQMVTSVLIYCGDEGTCSDSLCDHLCKCACQWVQLNPDVIPLLEADYNR